MAGGERGRAAGRRHPDPRGDPDDAAARRRVGRRADAGPGPAPLLSAAIAAGTCGFLGCAMDVVEVVPTFEQYAFTFGGVAPLRRIAPGTALRLWSDDAFCGALRSVKDLSQREGRPALRQPADRPVLRRGRRAGGHPGAALRRAGAGPGLGRLGRDPVLRRPDQHRPRRDPAGPAARHDLDLRARPGAEHRHLRRAAQRPADRPARRADARHGRASRRAGGEVRSSLVPERFGGNMDTPADARRHHLLPRRQRRGRPVLHRRRALPAGRGRGLRHGRRGRHDDDADRRADQGRRAARGRGSRTTRTG